MIWQAYGKYRGDGGERLIAATNKFLELATKKAILIEEDLPKGILQTRKHYHHEPLLIFLCQLF